MMEEGMGGRDVVMEKGVGEGVLGCREGWVEGCCDGGRDGGRNGWEGG